MSRLCTVCSHPNRADIDTYLISGMPNRRIAAQHQVSEQAVRRHKADHLPATLALTQTNNETIRAEELIAQAEELRNRTNRILTAAEEAGDQKTALAAIREARANTELLARMVGQIKPSQVNVSAQAAAASATTLEGEAGDQKVQITKDAATFQEIMASIVERKVAQGMLEG